MLLRSINHITITPKSKIQIILGTNSSGKSSLLKELSPLPANPSDYLKGGYKIINITHNNSSYILKCLFEVNGNKFHFIKDGEELNPGETVSTYKDLVKTYFNLDINIHDLLVGNINFHSMSVAERRNWFTKISDSDYTYAISFYQKLRDQLRDIQGALKINQSKLLSETDKLLSKEDEDKYLKEIKELNKLITHLLDLKTSNFISKDNTLDEITEIENKLTNLASVIITNKKKFDNKHNFSSIEDIDNLIIETKANITEISNRHIKLLDEIDTEQKTVSLLEKSNISSFKDIDKEITKLENEITKLEKQTSIKLVFDNNEKALNTLISILPNLSDIFSELEENKDRIYSPSYYTELNNNIKTLNNSIQNQDNVINKLIANKKQLEHYKEHNKLECPECKHKWVKNYSEKEYNNVLNSIELLAKDITDNKKSLEILEEKLEKTKTYLELYRSYNNICKSWIILNPIWEYFYNNNLIFESPRSLLSMLSSIQIDLEIYSNIDLLKEKLNNNIKIKNTLSENQELDVVKINNKITNLNSHIYNINLELINKRSLLVELNIYKNIAIIINNTKLETETLIELREDKIQVLENINKRNVINEIIQKLQIQLSNKERIISQTSIQKAIVDNLNKQSEELLAKAEVLRIMIKELSPTEGLIAKGLTGFINHFVLQMNSFIKQVWLYPLEIIPIALEENDELDLDYKFSVKVNDNNESSIPDINKGSTSVRDIVDLAFKIVSMRYLNIQNYPLYLDELGASFDKSHREAISKLIHDLVMSSDYSQVYIVSHYSETYGSFKNTDITVLCNENIDIPKDCVFNKNVIIN